MDRTRRDSRQHNGITLRALSQPTFATKSANKRHRKLDLIRTWPPTEAALLRMSASLFGALRQLDPFPSRSQPRHLVERAYCLLCLLAAFLGLPAESGCFVFRHGKQVAQKGTSAKIKRACTKGSGSWWLVSFCRSQSNAEPVMTEGVTSLVHRTGADVHCVSGCDTICGIKPAMTDPDRHPCPAAHNGLNRTSRAMSEKCHKNSCTAAKQHL